MKEETLFRFDRNPIHRDLSYDNILQTTKKKKKKRGEEHEEEGTKKNEHDVIVGNPDLSPKRETREDLGLFVRGRREKRRGEPQAVCHSSAAQLDESVRVSRESRTGHRRGASWM